MPLPRPHVNKYSMPGPPPPGPGGGHGRSTTAYLAAPVASPPWAQTQQQHAARMQLAPDAYWQPPPTSQPLSDMPPLYNFVSPHNAGRMPTAAVPIQQAHDACVAQLHQDSGSEGAACIGGWGHGAGAVEHVAQAAAAGGVADRLRPVRELPTVFHPCFSFRCCAGRPWAKQVPHAAWDCIPRARRLLHALWAEDEFSCRWHACSIHILTPTAPLLTSRSCITRERQALQPGAVRVL
jgi:hypothetical protein